MKAIGRSWRSLKRKRVEARKNQLPRQTLATARGVDIDLRLLPDRSESEQQQHVDHASVRLSWRGADLEEYTRAATLDRLLERVISSDEFHEGKSLSAFFLTHKIYIDSAELIQRFVNRFDSVVKTDVVMQQRILDLILFWLDVYSVDFKTNEQLLDRVDLFSETRKRLKDIDSVTLEKLEAVSTAVKDYRSQVLLVQDSDNEERLSNYTCVTPKEEAIHELLVKEEINSWQILLDPELDCSDIAGQLTKLEVNMFRKIKPSELLNVAWSSEGKDENAKNVRVLINHFNRLSRWVAGIMLEVDSNSDRIEMLKKFIGIATCCRELNNFNAVFEIIAGINSVAIHRLKLLDELPESTLNEYQELYTFIKSGGNYCTYRSEVSRLAENGVPCVPFLGVAFGDLRGIELSMTDFEESNNGNMLINFKKQVRVAEIIQNLLASFSPDFKIETIAPLSSFLRQELDFILTDEELWELSCSIKPSSCGVNK